MNSSFLYHAWGLYHHKCLREEYKGIQSSYISKVNELRNVVPNAAIPIWWRWVRARRPMLGPDFGKESDGRSSTSSMSPPISRPLSSPPYLKTARTPCRSSTIFMWSNWWMRSWTRYAGRNITWKRTLTSAKSWRGRATCCCAMERIYSTGNRGQGLTMPWIWTNLFHKPTTSKSNSERCGCSPINKQPKGYVWLGDTGAGEQSAAAEKMAVTIMAYRTGILAWYDCPISTGKVEGINNKTKVMKRVAYGFRDERYFQLRLYVLHDCRITPNVGWTLLLPRRFKSNKRACLCRLSCCIILLYEQNSFLSIVYNKGSIK